MQSHLVRTFTLAGPEGDGCHPYVSSKGAFIGNATPLLERDVVGGWQPRERSQLEYLLSKGYGEPVDLEGRMNGFAGVARALNEGNLALANISLVLLQLPALPDDQSAQRLVKANTLIRYDTNQPRVSAGNPDGGQWTSDGGFPSTSPPTEEPTGGQALDVTDIAYNGRYHDQVVAHYAEILRSEGIRTEINVPLTSLDGKYTAIADIILMNPHTLDLVLLEFKTGDDPTFTFNQSAIYPMAALGQHVFSGSKKITTFGFEVGALLPAIEVDQVYAIPGQDLRVTPLPPEILKFAKLLLGFSVSPFLSRGIRR